MRLVFPSVFVIVCTLCLYDGSGVLDADIVEYSNYNIIDDLGNASDNLAFFDLNLSTGKTSAQALADVQAMWADARLATDSEFSDFLFAAGVQLDSGTTVGADAWAFGATIVPTVTSPVTTMDRVRDTLGPSTAGLSIFFTDPDGLTGLTSTRDTVALLLNGQTNVSFAQTTTAGVDSLSSWLIVSPSAGISAVPEPTGIGILGLAMLGVAFRRKRN